MRSIRFDIPGIPYEVHGFPTGNGKALEEDRKKFERRIRLEYLRLGEGKLEGPLQVDVISYFEPPKSTGAKKRRMMLSGDIPCMKKPDTDEVTGCVFHALKGAAWKDESQVTHLFGLKLYGVTAHTEVLIIAER